MQKLKHQLWVALIMIISALKLQAAKVDTLMIKSASMDKMIANVVILPNNYMDTNRNYKVVYLLHGATGKYSDWVTKVPHLKQISDNYQCIIVCPDGGFTSWYFDSPIDDKMQYETYVSKELITAIDTKYRTEASKKGRAITGLSMGGHGALYLAFKHPNIWGAAGSMSGGVNIIPFPNSWDIVKRLGNYENNKQLWQQNTIVNMLELAAKADLKLIIDCGTEDFFYEENKKLHRLMIDQKIPHEYTERPGAHNWKYWQNAVKYHFMFFDDYFNREK
ncbi:MAG: esterase family protein [Sphingobacteriaceae bacterium]|nr:esterase family protein [Sphingobacteriaceae bacterium]